MTPTGPFPTRRLRPPDIGGRTDAPAAGLALGLLVVGTLAAVDATRGAGTVLTGALLLGPLVTSLLAGWRTTAIVGLAATALAIASGAWNHDFDTPGYAARAAALAVGSILATLGAAARARTNSNLTRFELLAAIADVADGSHPLAETVERLLDLVVPAFADLCTIDAVTEPAGSRHLGARVEAPNRAAIEQALLRRRTPDPEIPIGADRATRTGRSQLVTPIAPEHLRAIARDAADLDLLRSAGLRAALFVPLRARGRTIGSLACGVGPSGRRYADDDVRFAEVLAGRVALALDNAGLSAAVTTLEQRLEATLTNLAEAVTVQDRDGRTVYANPAAIALLRATALDEITAAAPGELIARFDVFDEDGHPVAASDLPGARVLKGEHPPPLLVRNVVHTTGEERWLLTKATPIFDASGDVSLAVNVIEDVTDAKRAELGQRLLAEAGRALASSLDYERTLQEVARLAVPALADWCTVTVADDDRALRQVAVAHVDAERVALARRTSERYRGHVSDPIGVAEVIRTGRARMARELTDEMLAAAAHDDDHLAHLKSLGMRSVIVAPLTTGRDTIGALSLVTAESGRVFDDDDLELAGELGRRAGTAVANARLYTERSRIAATLQRSLLPPRLPEVPGWSMASLYRAAGEQNEVGGDFYDAFSVQRGTMVVVGDVAGRGPDAAALTALARYTLRTAGQLLGDPLAATKRLNKALRERHQLSLVSVCCVLLRDARPDRFGPARAQVVLAGHPPPYLARAGAAHEVGALAPFLGAFDIGTWKAVDVDLEPGDRLVLYTDGVTDAVGVSGRFGDERLARAIEPASDADDTIRRIADALSAFEAGPQRDDTAVLVIQRTGGSRGARAARPPDVRSADSDDHAARNGGLTRLPDEGDEV